ncbi:MAG: DUF3999 family protein [Pseudomonadota bacterium]
MPAVYASAHDHPDREEMPDFVWSFTLDPDQSADAWRLELTPEVMQRLNRSSADDLMIVDRQGRPVPYARVPGSMFTENTVERRTLLFQGSLIAADQPEKPELSLEFEHNGARLRVNAPESESRIDASESLRYEALMALRESDELVSDAHMEVIDQDTEYARLQIEFQTEQRMRMTCWLRSADSDAPATRSTQLSIQQESRPLRYLGELQVPISENAWHLTCYGPDAPSDDLELIDAEWLRNVQRDYQHYFTLVPEIERVSDSPGTLQFQLPAAYRADQMSLASDRTGVFSRLQISSRNHVETDWRKRGEMTLSSLENGNNRPLVFDRQSNRRHRLWKIEAEPPLDHIPAMEFDVMSDTIIFLAQGEPPWQLQVGSYTAGNHWLSQRSLDELSESLGPIWLWPEISVSAPERIGDDSLLEPPTEPIKWSRYLLWLVLMIGSVLVVFMAVRLLRSPLDRR